MSEKIISLITGIFLLASTGAVTAQATAEDPLDQELRGYVGGGFGYYRLDDEDFLDEDDELRDNRAAWRVFGGLEFNRIFSLEVGYNDFGETNDGELSLDADGWTIAGVAAIPVSQWFAPYARVGQMYWDRERSIGPISHSDDGDDMFYGVGARFTLSETTDLRLEYDRMAMDDTDLDLAALYVQYRF
ncbi:opacity protein-like surface antigen [Natronospira proteinivora]|uniref:Opacity protein-like surface antigen n=1 Tax=Natronospira proteinivora TaxID=1807133 RepID=A0ABT1G7G0_9GAMM|nr:porin family protein [Natronospira proteinivora]MCP1727230.1 opacity protein-like surface antigen [Natronospira proteinivora]